tara:strand:+ start:27911 stop:28159 length:249 start_codon:yes stop_codon:yes gene_type:complete
MSEKELAFILRYSTPTEILIINYENKIVRLCCPFTVRVISSVGCLEVGKYYDVEGVLVDDKVVTVFKILDQHFYYYHFVICI